MSNVVQVDIGYKRACITEDGYLYTWDWGTKPKKVLKNAALVKGYGNCSLCVTQDGKLYKLGYNMSKPKRIKYFHDGVFEDPDAATEAATEAAAEG